MTGSYDCALSQCVSYKAEFVFKYRAYAQEQHVIMYPCYDRHLALAQAALDAVRRSDP